MAEKYMEGRGTIARLSDDMFDVERLKKYSESFPTTSPSDAARMYWKAQLGGVDDAGQNVAAKIQHIFDMADSDDPQDRGVFYLPGSACRSAAMALTALHEHFERLRTDTGTAEEEGETRDREEGCIGRVKEAFSLCQSNQAPALQNELEVAGLTRPKVATLDGFIRYAVVELKRHCAGKAIEEALGIRVEAYAHQYSRALRILDGYFRVGGTIPGFQESWSRPIGTEMSELSHAYVEAFTKDALINHFVQRLNHSMNGKMRYFALTGSASEAERFWRWHCRRWRRVTPRRPFEADGKRFTNVEGFVEYKLLTTHPIRYEDVEELLKTRGLLR